MKKNILYVALLFLPLLFSCNTVENDGVVEVDVHSLRVVNIDGSSDKFLSEGSMAQVTPDSKRIIFRNKGLFSIGIGGDSLYCINKNESIRDFLLSPDGNKIIFTADSQRVIYSTNLDGSQVSRLYESQLIKSRFRFSNDGKSLYFVESAPKEDIIPNLSELDSYGNYRVLMQHWQLKAMGQPEVSPDGKSVIYYQYPSEGPYLALRNLSTQKDTFLDNCNRSYGSKLVKFTSQNTFLYVYQNSVWSYDLITGYKKKFVLIPGDLYSYSDDGTYILYQSYPNISLVQLEESTIKRIPAQGFHINDIILTPDYKKVVYEIITSRNL